MTNLKKTDGKFKLIGQITGLGKENAFKEESIDGKGVRRNLRFGVKTSDSNTVYVGAMAYTPKEVYMWDSKKKESLKIEYAKYVKNANEYSKQGITCLQSRVGWEFETAEKDGKTFQRLKSHGMPKFVAISQIYAKFNDGDSVVVEGTVSHSKDQKGEVRTNYNVEKVLKLQKDVDFNAEDFEEVSYYEQPFVFVSTYVNDEETKMFVSGRTIDYSLKWNDVKFVVNMKDSTKKMFEAFQSSIDFGDVISVWGDIVNRSIKTDGVDEDDDDDDILAIFGGKKKPNHANKKFTYSYVSEMTIEGVTALEREVYTHDDFVEETKEVDPFGINESKKPSKLDDPFATDNYKTDVDEDDDLLPF